MNRMEKVHDMIIGALNHLTDEQRLEAVGLHDHWAAEHEYRTGDVVQYYGYLYRCLQPHKSYDIWAPSVTPSLWALVLIPDPEEIPEWVQPDSTNAYARGDKVMHNGSVWVSDYDHNTWEPGTSGWTEVTE